MRAGSAPTNRIEALEIVDIAEDNPNATTVGDLTERATLPADSFDCVICTQTLCFIYDVREALATMYHALRPGGVLLATVPGVARNVTDEDFDDFWRFTSKSTRLLLEELFPSTSVQIEAFGNVLSAAAFLYGLAAGELTAAELDFHDDRYEVLIGVRAVKPSDFRGPGQHAG
jgi:SAM-dependent methyltransferase